jgi:pimeloyl-CoA synthetase
MNAKEKLKNVERKIKIRKNMQIKKSSTPSYETQIEQAANTIKQELIGNLGLEGAQELIQEVQKIQDVILANQEKK